MPCAFSFIPVPQHKNLQKYKIVISLNIIVDPVIVYIVITVDIDMCLRYALGRQLQRCRPRAELVCRHTQTA